MEQQKQVLCIQDLSCLGRCSLAVALPVLSACGHAVTPLPTALLSAHTGGFGTPARAEQGAFCNAALSHYQALHISFDSVYSGYLADESQAMLVRRAFALAPHALKLVDPVLGDAGRPYRFVTSALVRAMKSLCHEADWITPNATESALLLGLAPDDSPLTPSQARARARLLAETYGVGVVLTGLELMDKTCVNVLAGRPGADGAQPEEPLLLPFDRVPGQWPGTGDLFAACLLGMLLSGAQAAGAVAGAARFVAACAVQAAKSGREPRFGVPFEHCLSQLIKGDDLLWNRL